MNTKERYLIVAEASNGLIKLATARNLDERLKEIAEETPYSTRLYMAMTYPNALAAIRDFAQLYNAFEDRLIDNQWFDVPLEKVNEAIQVILNTQPVYG